MMSKGFVTLYLLSVLFAEAVEFDVDGQLTCACQSCRSVANVQLWEEDTISTDDYMGEAIVRQNEFHLKFDESEIGGVSPYLLIRHDCVSDFWIGGKKDQDKLLCYVQERHKFEAPSGSVAKLDIVMGNDDYENMEICVPRAEFRRIFGGDPITNFKESSRRFEIIHDPPLFDPNYVAV